MSVANLAPGTVFAGDYRIERSLRKGGQGAVYEVEQLSTGHKRALKLMHPELVRDRRMNKRFVQEARIGSRIDSDHVVQVMAAGIDAATGIPWIAMELLKGADLATVLKARGPLPPDEVDEIFGQLCHALGAAHEVGIVHRDVKPENIFVAGSRRDDVRFTVKVLDFGLAKLVRDAAAVTRTEAMGTPFWMAPEQTVESGQIGPPTDVWALGLVAFALLTGRQYWRSANGPLSPAALLKEIKYSQLEAASSRASAYACEDKIPEGFDDWFGRCVERDMVRRYPDARAARAGLAAVLRGSRPAAAPRPARKAPHKPQPTTESLSRNRALLLALLAGAAISVILLTVLVMLSGVLARPRPTPTPGTASRAPSAAQAQPPAAAPTPQAPSDSQARLPALPPASSPAVTPVPARTSQPSRADAASPPAAHSETSEPPAPPPGQCDPPYTIDKYNTRIPKPECM